jgi:hypothetical protein
MTRDERIAEIRRQYERRDPGRARQPDDNNVGFLLAHIDALVAERNNAVAALRDAATVNPWTHAQSVAEKACARLGIGMAEGQP